METWMEAWAISIIYEVKCWYMNELYIPISETVNLPYVNVWKEIEG